MSPRPKPPKPRRSRLGTTRPTSKPGAKQAASGSAPPSASQTPNAGSSTRPRPTPPAPPPIYRGRRYPRTTPAFLPRTDARRGTTGAWWTGSVRCSGSLRVQRLDVDVPVLRIGAADGLGEARRGAGRDLDAGLAREDLDLSDLALGDVAAPAEQRDQPLRIGVLRAADVDREPGAAVPGALLAARTAGVDARAGRARVRLQPRVVPRLRLSARTHRRRQCQLFGRGARLAPEPDERGDEIFGRRSGEQRSRRGAVVLGEVLGERPDLAD